MPTLHHLSGALLATSIVASTSLVACVDTPSPSRASVLVELQISAEDPAFLTDRRDYLARHAVDLWAEAPGLVGASGDPVFGPAAYEEPVRDCVGQPDRSDPLLRWTWRGEPDDPCRLVLYVNFTATVRSEAHTSVPGAAILGTRTALIAYQDSDERLITTLSHEFGHLLFHGTLHSTDIPALTMSGRLPSGVMSDPVVGAVPTDSDVAYGCALTTLCER